MINCSIDIETKGVPENCSDPFVMSLSAFVFDDLNQDFRYYFHRVFNENQKGEKDSSTDFFWDIQEPIVRRSCGLEVTEDELEKIGFDFNKEIKTETFDISFIPYDPVKVFKDFRIWSKTWGWNIDDESSMKKIRRHYDLNDSRKFTWWAMSPSFDMRILENLNDQFIVDSVFDSSILVPWRYYTKDVNLDTVLKSFFFLERDVRVVKEYCDFLNFSQNQNGFMDRVKSDFKKMGLGKFFDKEHFSLYDCAKEGSDINNMNTFILQAKEVLYGN